MDIQDMRIFARVAAVQNLSAVGLELGLTPGTISKRIQALEEELSARLFDRTTRSIRITEEGATFLVHVERILSEIEMACASVDDRVNKPKGTLRMVAPASMGRRYVAPALCEFMRSFPDIGVQLDIDDRPVRLHEDGYDVAIRTGALPDSTLIAKRLGPDRHIVAASPGYIARKGRPVQPADLAAHDCLASNEHRQWSFRRHDAENSVRITGPLRSNDGEVLCLAALEGLGIIRASEFELLPELEMGRLVQVLGDYHVSTNAAIWALYPSAKHMLPRMRVLLDFLANWFREVRDGSQRRATRSGAFAAEDRRGRAKFSVRTG